MKAPAPRLECRSRVDVGDYPADAVWSSDGHALVVAGGQGSMVWIDTTAAQSVKRLREHAGGSLAVAWQGGGRQFASSGQDGEVRLWDAASGESRLIYGGAEWSERLAFASHGRLLAVGTGRALRVFDGHGHPLEQLPQQSGVIAALAFRPRTNELATLGNGGASLHRLEPIVETREFPWQGACLTASWSPDGRVLASGMQDGSVHYWNIGDGTQSQMRGYGAKVTLTSWSANSRFLATAADQQIVVWDFSGRGPVGSEPAQLAAHTARLTQLAFQPRGPLLAATARDHRVTLWRLAEPQQPCDADLLTDEAVLLRWSNDGAQLAVADRGGTISFYALGS